VRLRENSAVRYVWFLCPTEMNRYGESAMLNRLTLFVVCVTLLTVACGTPEKEPEEETVQPSAQTTDGPELPPVPSTLFRFCDNGKWGYINRQGEVVIKPRFLVAGDFSDGLAAAFRSKDGNGYINEKGQLVFADPEGCFCTRPFSEGLAAFSVGTGRDEKWGFLDKTGKVVIEPKYVEAWDFSEGLARVAVGGEWNLNQDRYRGSTWGYVDRSGHEIVKPTMSSASDFSGGLALIVRPLDKSSPEENRYAYIDKTGKIVFRLEYKAEGTTYRIFDAEGFSEGLAWVSVRGRGSGFIDKTGKFVIKPQFLSRSNFSEGLAFVYSRQSVSYIDRSGQAIITLPPRAQDARRFSEGLAAVQVGDNWGYIDKQGNFRIGPEQRDDWPGPINEAREFSGGLARVHMGGKEVRESHDIYWVDGAWYYINRQGDVVHLYKRDPER